MFSPLSENQDLQAISRSDCISLNSAGRRQKWGMQAGTQPQSESASPWCQGPDSLPGGNLPPTWPSQSFLCTLIHLSLTSAFLLMDEPDCIGFGCWTVQGSVSTLFWMEKISMAGRHLPNQITQAVIGQVSAQVTFMAMEQLSSVAEELHPPGDMGQVLQ